MAGKELRNKQQHSIRQSSSRTRADRISHRTGTDKKGAACLAVLSVPVLPLFCRSLSCCYFLSVPVLPFFVGYCPAAFFSSCPVVFSRLLFRPFVLSVLVLPFLVGSCAVVFVSVPVLPLFRRLPSCRFSCRFLSSRFFLSVLVLLLISRLLSFRFLLGSCPAFFVGSCPAAIVGSCPAVFLLFLLLPFFCRFLSSRFSCRLLC